MMRPTDREIVIGLIAQQLRSVPREERAQLVAEALAEVAPAIEGRSVPLCANPTHEHCCGVAAIVEEMIG